MSSYQTSEYNLNSPMIKSSDLKPLLMINRPQGALDMNSPNSPSKRMAESGMEKYSTSKIKIV